MANNSKHKETLINFFHDNYPFALKVEFDFLMEGSVVSKFFQCSIYDVNLNKKYINGSNFFGVHEGAIITIIEQNDISMDIESNNDIKGTFKIDLNDNSIEINFYELVETEEYLGTFKI
jgi:hypothetical protein